jgi:hypothetical protein
VLAQVDVGTVDLADAAALAADGLLTTSAEVVSSGGFASAVATSHFIGTFLAPVDPVTLFFDFINTDLTDLSSLSLGTLVLQVVSGGTTVGAEVITSQGSYQRTFVLVPGTSSSIDLLLVSEADTTSAGTAFNLAPVTYGTDVGPVGVPEPASAALLAVGIAGVAALRRRALR